MGKLNINANLELIQENTELNEAFASVSLNPYFQWAKIVVLDDVKNTNKQRIPEEEFVNIIKTGRFAPIKMADGEISDGHQEAYGRPIGTLTQLAQEGNKILALAALWKKERPDEIAMLKDMYEKGTPPNVSWELAFEDSRDEDGVEVLLGTALTGLAVVGLPAYAGRTKFVAMSSKNNKEEDSVEEELNTLKTEVAQLKETVGDLTNKLEAKTTELDTATAELETLRTYKEEVEAEKAKAEKLASVKAKFTEAGIEKDSEYFAEKEELLLSLSDEALDFMIQELVAFSANAENNNSTASEKKTKIPAVTNTEGNVKDPKELGRLLRESKSKK